MVAEQHEVVHVIYCRSIMLSHRHTFFKKQVISNALCLVNCEIGNSSPQRMKIFLILNWSFCSMAHHYCALYNNNVCFLL